MSPILSLSLRELCASLQAKKVGALEVTRACLERIEATEPQIGAFLTVDAENALARARDLDSRGPDPSMPLWGAPIAIKDAISTKGLRTTSASRILENFVPVYDAFVIERLKKAGAIILGKVNMDEFAMGSTTGNSAFRKTRNPWNTERIPGGSSGGSAACVAARQCFASLGSDTGGSIRQPAAFCGCVGLKPTYGRVSRYGLFAFASSLDQIGPLARRVGDCALMLKVIAGHDPRDNTSSPAPVEDYLAALEAPAGPKPLAGLKLGFPESFFGEGLEEGTAKACLNAIGLAEKLGAELVKIDLPDPDVATATYYIISMAEASSNLARYDGVRYGRRAAGASTLEELYTRSRSEGFGQEVKRRIMLGAYTLSSGYYDAYFRKAAQTRRLIRDSYFRALEKCSAICMPVAPMTAWRLGENEEDPLKTYLLDAFTLPANLAGLPGISLPVGLEPGCGMPVGMQLVGPQFGESLILRMAAILEKALPEPGEPALRGC